MAITNRKPTAAAPPKGASRAAPRARPLVDAVQRTHWVSTKLAAHVRREKGGYGLFAAQEVSAGELLVMWGGDIVTGERLVELSPVARRHSIQVEEHLYLVPHQLPEAGDFVNHSCDPNAGMSGQAGVIALRRIAPGEEVCFDYAMSDGSSYDEFDCSCSAEECRGRITGSDWRLPALQLRYSGYFSPYLQKRIEASRHGAGRGHAPSVASLLVEATS